MKVIFHIVYNFNNNIKPEESIKPEKNTKFVVHFFGMGGFIKVNVLGKNKKKSSESDKQENGIEANVLGENEKKSSEYDEEKNGFKRVDYYFDYPFFSDIVNPEHFCKELRSREKKFTGTIVPLCLLVLSVLAFTLVILLALAVIFFAVSAVWLLFDFIKERFVVHRLENLLEGLDPELVKLYKNQLIGKQSNEGVHGQKPEKSEDIKDIVNFLLKGDKVLALYKFLTNGEKLVQAGMAMVNKLLLEGVHPNDIILDTNSLGGGIAAEVLKRFAELGIYLTLIHSNSYCTLKDASNNFPHVGKLFTKQLPTKFVNVWFRRCGLEWDQQKVIEKDVKESPVMVAGRDGDTVIPPEKAQLADRLPSLITPQQFRVSVVLKHNQTECKNKENIHIDDEGHLIVKYIKLNNDELEPDEICISFIEMKNYFISEMAHKYLINSGLNKDFNLEEYVCTKLSEGLTTEVTLVPMFENQNVASRGHSL